jgi:hypothetical protein
MYLVTRSNTRSALTLLLSPACPHASCIKACTLRCFVGASVTVVVSQQHVVLIQR